MDLPSGIYCWSIFFSKQTINDVCKAQSIEEIKGTVGAGDSFAAGMLYGLHESWPIEECLNLATCVSASCLYDTTTSGGILPLDECLALGKRYGYR